MSEIKKFASEKKVLTLKNKICKFEVSFRLRNDNNESSLKE